MDVNKVKKRQTGRSSEQISYVIISSTSASLGISLCLWLMTASAPDVVLLAFYSAFQDLSSVRIFCHDVCEGLAHLHAGVPFGPAEIRRCKGRV